MTSGVAGRYATALFDLAKESNDLDKVEADILALEGALAVSPEFREVLASPVHSRDEHGRVIAAVADKLGQGVVVKNTLGLIAQNRRLFILPELIAQMKALIADERGEVTAEVTSARPLSEEQAKTLKETLKASVGKDVKLDTTVDESLIGGLVVRLGSRMIDTSIRAKLAQLQNVMKEVG
jgi:F-type H+-transporting ATPase subunit delta